MQVATIWRVVQLDIILCVFKFPPLRMGTLPKLSGLFCMPSISQEQKLGVVAATVEAVSLQLKIVSQSSPTAKANRSDFSSSLGLGYQLQAGMCKCKCRSYSRPAIHRAR